MKLEDAIQSQTFKSEKDKAVLHIMFTAYQLKSSLNTTLKPFGLTPEQYNVLRILKGKHPQSMCVKNIGSRMIERSSNVPRIIDRLVLKELVKRTQSEEDKRETVIVLTEKGIAILHGSTARLDENLKKTFFMKNAEAAALNVLLAKINGA